MTELGWVDWALIAIVALSVLLGIVRGLTREIMSLAGWVVAYLAAQAFCARVAPEVPLGAPGSGLNLAAAFVVVLVAALVAWSICSWMVSKMVKASLLNPIDRTLGAVFGLARGLVLVLLVGTLTLLTPLSQEPAWRASHGAAGLHYVLAELKPLLPASVARHLRAAASPAGVQSKG
ncbi:CvpA family protein [Rivibacter subsaxonicus]|uniref:Membrane protein required for colicin V production n=1 Tax=Rivibacter subsaxonicus TaxID=457575 RepID=A0A4Q7VP09_9BURK|nr:CvpA family protein [Rivibacter subsaxonicus]RZT98131.1 membrane protein required for colicin V production [Rivibacter subsaxonicus]